MGAYGIVNVVLSMCEDAQSMYRTVHMFRRGIGMGMGDVWVMYG